MFNCCGLLNLSSWVWYKFNATNFTNFLDLRYWTNNAWPHKKPTGRFFFQINFFLIQKWSDFNKSPTLLNRDVDREVSTQRPHPVKEAQCSTLNQVPWLQTVWTMVSFFLFPTVGQLGASSFYFQGGGVLHWWSPLQNDLIKKLCTRPSQLLSG